MTWEMLLEIHVQDLLCVGFSKKIMVLSAPNPGKEWNVAAVYEQRKIIFFSTQGREIRPGVFRALHKL